MFSGENNITCMKTTQSMLSEGLLIRETSQLGEATWGKKNGQVEQGADWTRVKSKLLSLERRKH